MPSSVQPAASRRRGRTLCRSSLPIARRQRRNTSQVSATQLAVGTSPPPLPLAPPSSQAPSSRPLLGDLDSEDNDDLEDGEKYVWLYRSSTMLAVLHERPCTDKELHPGETLAHIPSHEATFEMTLCAIDRQSRIVADSSGTRLLFQNHPDYSTTSWED
ncbi:hypothetical protein BKA70DRAFT_1443794 [Coprinopsis sp. MPI-PUGE-AT-0042]|nr:hypothetical protein BKA70DRAFT_1443794 [Coprinopsis sp. MPI-PUGE-AT-0042]